MPPRKRPKVCQLFNADGTIQGVSVQANAERRAEEKRILEEERRREVTVGIVTLEELTSGEYYRKKHRAERQRRRKNARPRPPILPRRFVHSTHK